MAASRLTLASQSMLKVLSHFFLVLGMLSHLPCIIFYLHHLISHSLSLTSSAFHSTTSRFSSQSPVAASTHLFISAGKGSWCQQFRQEVGVMGGWRMWMEAPTLKPTGSVMQMFQSSWALSRTVKHWLNALLESHSWPTTKYFVVLYRFQSDFMPQISWSTQCSCDS